MTVQTTFVIVSITNNKIFLSPSLLVLQENVLEKIMQKTLNFNKVANKLKIAQF